MPRPNAPLLEQARIDGPPVTGAPDVNQIPGTPPPMGETGAQAGAERSGFSDKLTMVVGWAGDCAVTAAVAVKGASVRAANKAREVAPVAARLVREHGPAVAALAVETGLHAHVDRKAQAMPRGVLGGLVRIGVDVTAAAAEYHNGRRAHA